MLEVTYSLSVFLYSCNLFIIFGYFIFIIFFLAVFVDDNCPFCRPIFLLTTPDLFITSLTIVGSLMVSNKTLPGKGNLYFCIVANSSSVNPLFISDIICGVCSPLGPDSSNLFTCSEYGNTSADVIAFLFLSNCSINLSCLSSIAWFERF